MFDFSVKDHRPLRDMVYGELRTLILTGKIRPGTRMMEIELADEMGVSRTPVREAIRKLEEEGLVFIEPRRGAYVSEVSVPDMVNILEVRGSLEGLAAYFAAQRMRQEKRAELREISARFDRALESGNMNEMIQNDTLFHRAIVDGSNNSYLVHMVERMQELVLRFRYIYYKDFKRAEEMPDEHCRIFSAIIESRAEDARNEAEMHITKLKEMILRDGLA
jgi:DNA-binding GntR family transcriptional regulator